MAVESDRIPNEAKPPTQSLYTRNSTGFVRELKLLDQITYSWTASTPLVGGLIISWFLLVSFPRVNMLVAIILAGIVSSFVWMTFALLTATLPKTGGDYVFNSRILSAPVGFGINLCVIVAMPLTVGVASSWMATLALSPTFAVMGFVTGSKTLTNWGNFFAADHHTVVFVTAALTIIAVGALAMLGTRLVVRTMSILVCIFGFAWVVALVILLIAGHSSFIGQFNHYAGAGAYNRVVHAGAGKGLYPSEGGYSSGGTIGSMFQILGVCIFCMYGTYIAAETRRARQRATMVKSLVGAGSLQIIAMVITILIFYAAVGQHFFISATAGNLGLSNNINLASFVFLAAIGAHAKVLTVILAFCFLLWVPPLVHCFMAVCQRGLFAYSFDRLLPSRVAEVNERTHTPVVAISITVLLSIGCAAWAAYSTTYVTVLETETLLAFVALVGAGLSGIVMARRRPDLYKGSPADWHPFGIPVLLISGIGATLAVVFGFVDLLVWHTNYAITHIVWTAIAPFVVFGVGVVWWYLARARRRKEGIDLDLIYKSIPPD